MPTWVLAVTGTLTGMAWVALIGGGETHVVWRIVRIIAAALTAFVLAKNIADVLWFGHDPIFSEIPAIFGG
jgi:hypothetical protein